MAAVAADFKKARPHIEAAAGIRLAGPDGAGSAEISAKGILFNGPADCGHPEGVIAAIRSITASGSCQGGQVVVDQPKDLVAPGTCDGDCSFETFLLSPKVAVRRDDGWRSDSVATGRLPYDLAVTACLIIAKRHYGADLRVRSDGETNDWAGAARVVKAALGYGVASMDGGELFVK